MSFRQHPIKTTKVALASAILAATVASCSTHPPVEKVLRHKEPAASRSLGVAAVDTFYTRAVVGFVDIDQINVGTDLKGYGKDANKPVGHGKGGLQLNTEVVFDAPYKGMVITYNFTLQNSVTINTDKARLYFLDNIIPESFIVHKSATGESMTSINISKGELQGNGKSVITPEEISTYYYDRSATLSYRVPIGLYMMVSVSGGAGYPVVSFSYSIDGHKFVTYDTVEIRLDALSSPRLYSNRGKHDSMEFVFCGPDAAETAIFGPTKAYMGLYSADSNGKFIAVSPVTQTGEFTLEREEGLNIGITSGNYAAVSSGNFGKPTIVDFNPPIPPLLRK